MTLYVTARVLHIVGALGMFMALGVDLSGVAALGRSRTADQVRRALEGYRINAILGPITLVLLLVPGMYMATVWAWQPWLRVAFVTLVSNAVLGATITRRRLQAISRALPREGERLGIELQHRLHDPLLRTSFVVRAFLSLGILILMTTKPDLGSSLMVIAVALLTAGAVSVPFWMPPRKVAGTASGALRS
jgi:hypothetical protein